MGRENYARDVESLFILYIFFVKISLKINMRGRGGKIQGIKLGKRK
jgi:hypothetical protein